jgi:hypothetical protein
LTSGAEFAFAPRTAQGLEAATASDLHEIEISPSGFGLHFPKLDADLWLPALLEGNFGTTRWMAARLGAQGGKARSAAKTRAARANGKLGGRPHKRPARVGAAKKGKAKIKKAIEKAKRAARNSTSRRTGSRAAVKRRA